MTITQLEPYVGKRGVCEHFAVGITTVEGWVRDECPSVFLEGRRKFKLSEVEDWLRRSGKIRP